MGLTNMRYEPHSCVSNIIHIKYQIQNLHMSLFVNLNRTVLNTKQGSRKCSKTKSFIEDVKHREEVFDLNLGLSPFYCGQFRGQVLQAEKLYLKAPLWVKNRHNNFFQIHWLNLQSLSGNSPLIYLWLEGRPRFVGSLVLLPWEHLAEDQSGPVPTFSSIW